MNIQLVGKKNQQVLSTDLILLTIKVTHEISESTLRIKSREDLYDTFAKKSSPKHLPLNPNGNIVRESINSPGMINNK